MTVSNADDAFTLLADFHVMRDHQDCDTGIVQFMRLDATLIEKEDWPAAVWSANNRIFVIEMDGSAEEVLTVAESVTLIP